MLTVGKSLNQLSAVINAENLDDKQRKSIIDCVQRIENVMNQLNAQELGIEKKKPTLNLKNLLMEYEEMLKHQKKDLNSKSYRYDSADHLQKVYFEDNLYLLMLEKILMRLTNEKELQQFFHHCKAMQFKMFQKLEEEPVVQTLN